MDAANSCNFSSCNSTICIENNSHQTTIRMDKKTIKKAQTIGHRIETKGNGDRSDRWKFKVEWQKTTTLSGGKKKSTKNSKGMDKSNAKNKKNKNKISRGELQQQQQRTKKKQSENCTRLQTMSVLVPELHTCIIEMKQRIVCCCGRKHEMVENVIKCAISIKL